VDIELMVYGPVESKKFAKNYRQIDRKYCRIVKVKIGNLQ
jgi:hypothetical protein